MAVVCKRKHKLLMSDPAFGKSEMVRGHCSYLWEQTGTCGKIGHTVSWLWKHVTCKKCLGKKPSDGGEDEAQDRRSKNIQSSVQGTKVQKKNRKR